MGAAFSRLSLLGLTAGAAAGLAAALAHGRLLAEMDFARAAVALLPVAMAPGAASSVASTFLLPRGLRAGAETWPSATSAAGFTALALRVFAGAGGSAGTPAGSTFLRRTARTTTFLCAAAPTPSALCIISQNDCARRRAPVIIVTPPTPLGVAWPGAGPCSFSMNMAAVTSRHAPHLSRGHRHQMHVAWQATSAVHSCQAGPCNTMPCPAQLGAAQQHRSISNLPQQQCWRAALVHDAQQRPYLLQPLLLSACAAALCLWQVSLPVECFRPHTLPPHVSIC